ncbi:MAG: hypothetical protein AB7G87_01380 [Clostridia bacterium]
MNSNHRVTNFTEFNCPYCGSGLEENELKATDINCIARYRCIACSGDFIRPSGKDTYEKFMGLPYLIDG